MSVYLSVFGAALLAATILPFYSELAVSAAVLGGYSPLAVWAWASVGNTLGAIINGWLGRALGDKRVRQKLRISQSAYDTGAAWFNRFGVWSLLFAWLPIGGDALTVLAGTLRVPWRVFVPLVFIGKAGRYAILIYALVKTGAA